MGLAPLGQEGSLRSDRSTNSMNCPAALVSLGKSGTNSSPELLPTISVK